MAQFTYRAVDMQGNSKKGRVSAFSMREAARSLRENGYYPISIRPSLKVVPSFSILQKHKISLQEISQFCREASLLIDNAVPLDRVLQLTAQQRSNALGEALRRVEHAVSQGSSLGQALQKEARMPQLLWQAVRSAELTGELGRVFQELADYFAAEALRNSKIDAIVFYPKMILFFALMIAVFIVNFLMPSYLDLFIRSETELPRMTRDLLNLSGVVRRYWWIIIALAFCAVRLFRALGRRLKIHYNWDRFLLRIPIYGVFLRNRMLAQFCSAMAMLLKVGITLDRALFSCENLPDRPLWRDTLRHVRRRVSIGDSFAEVMELTGVFPEQLVQLLLIGETSGTLDILLGNMAKYYNDQATWSGERMLYLLQPLVMLATALLVGSLALALLMPLYTQLDLIDNLATLR